MAMQYANSRSLSDLRRVVWYTDLSVVSSQSHVNICHIYGLEKLHVMGTYWGMIHEIIYIICVSMLPCPTSMYGHVILY